MKPFEEKIKNREVIYIEDFVLVKSNLDKTYNDKEDRNDKKNEKGAYVGVGINKDNVMQYNIYNKQGEKIGIADYKTGKILKWSHKYKLNKKLNVKEMLENQLNKEKERNLRSVSDLKKKEQEKNNKEQAKTKKEDPLNKTKGITNKKQKEKSQKDQIISQKQLSQINNVKIKDYEFVADLIDPNKYNIYDTYFINNNGRFEMVAYDFNLGGYKKIDEYMYKQTKFGEMDTVEKNRKETEIGYGCEVTFINRHGNREILDAKQGATGEIELRKKGNIDKDKTIEGIKIATDRDNQNDKVEKVEKEKKDLEEDDEHLKKEPGITYSKGIKMFRGRPAE